MNDAQYPYLLKELAPEFEAKRGAKVNLDILGFAVYNQPADLELSTKGSSWDFVNVTSIYTGRWIGPSRLPRPLNIQKIPLDPPNPGWRPRNDLGGPTTN
jgi:spermidine/putrescine-binding protein